MSKYQDRRIISETHGNKKEADTVKEYNETLTNLSGAGNKEVVDSDYKLTQEIINGLKINNYDGGSTGSLRSTSTPPKENQYNKDFFGGKLKDKYYEAVLNNDKSTQKKILEMPDKIVGVLDVFQRSNSDLQSALDKPSGAPGSPNVGLISKNLNFFKYIQEFNFNGDKNINIDIDEDNNLLMFTDDTEPIYVDSLISQQKNPNPNSEKIIPVLGDPQKIIYEPMDSVGPMPLIEQITTSLKFPKKEGDEQFFDLDQNIQIESQLVNYDHTPMLDLKSVGQSLWPQAQQMAVSGINTIDPDSEERTPLQEKLLSIFSEYNQNISSDINLVEDYMKNGGEKWGIYMGADSNYDQKNAPLVKFQRDILAWSFNNGYHSQNVLPYIKEEQSVKQGDNMSDADKEYEDSKESNNLFDETVEKVNIV
jgi:hypothetical protein